jgi:hypothetical protein
MFQVLEILVKGLGENIKKNKLAIHHRGTEGTEKGVSLLGRRKNFFEQISSPCGQEIGRCIGNPKQIEMRKIQMIKDSLAEHAKNAESVKGPEGGQQRVKGNVSRSRELHPQSKMGSSRLQCWIKAWHDSGKDSFNLFSKTFLTR